MTNSTLDSYWYKDKALLQGAVQEFGSLARAADAIGGVDASTLQKQWRRMGMEKLAPGPKPRPPEDEDALRRLHKRVYGG